MKNFLPTFRILLILSFFFSACQTPPTSVPQAERTGPTLDLSTTISTELVSPTLVLSATNTIQLTETPSPVYSPLPSPSLIPELSPSIPTATATLAASPTPTPTIPPFTRTLKLSSPTLQGDDVLVLQQRLADMGYTEVGTPDGDFGKKTDSAVRNFQIKAGLLADGIVGLITWQALFSSPLSSTGGSQTKEPSVTPDPYFKVLQYGDYSAAVGTLKTILQNLGYPICDPKNNFNLQTVSALKAFQQVNDLTIDGIAGQVTWAVLTSAKAIPAPQPSIETLKFRTPFRLEVTGDALIYEDDTRLLVALDSQHRILRIDPKGPSIIKSISMPSLGTAEDPFGGTHPVYFVLDDILVANKLIWVGGGTAYGASLREPAVMALESNGKLAGGPFKFGGWDDAAFQSLVQVGKDTLAFYVSYSSGPSLWLLNSKTGITWKADLDLSVMSATNSTYDGRKVWLTLPDEGQAVVSFNPTYGILGSALGPCGIDVAFDGTWLWVLQSKQAAAYDITTGELQKLALSPTGFTLNSITAREGQVAILGHQAGKPYLLLLDY